MKKKRAAIIIPVVVFCLLIGLIFFRGSNEFGLLSRVLFASNCFGKESLTAIADISNWQEAGARAGNYTFTHPSSVLVDYHMDNGKWVDTISSTDGRYKATLEYTDFLDNKPDVPTTLAESGNGLGGQIYFEPYSATWWFFNNEGNAADTEQCYPNASGHTVERNSIYKQVSDFAEQGFSEHYIIVAKKHKDIFPAVVDVQVDVNSPASVNSETFLRTIEQILQTVKFQSNGTVAG